MYVYTVKQTKTNKNKDKYQYNRTTLHRLPCGMYYNIVYATKSLDIRYNLSFLLNIFKLLREVISDGREFHTVGALCLKECNAYCLVTTDR